MPAKTTVADLAPHGYEADGVTPKAPYGYRKDGVPRKSNRGARPGAFGGGGAASAPKASKTDAKRVQSLVMAAEIAICTPLAAASTNKLVKRYLGEKHADALAADALIISMHSDVLARGMIEYAQDHPGFLSAMDVLEEKATSLTLLYAAQSILRAIVSNHLSPDPRVAEAGRMMAKTRAVKAAQAAQAEAERYGLVGEDQDPDGEGYDGDQLLGDEQMPAAA